MAIAERFQGANVVDAGRMSPYWGEHAARYKFALDHVWEKKVLDIACGTGYGVGLLRRVAAFVTGVDIDEEAARDAKTECGDNAGVLLGNGLGLPFADSTFDVITSFETLEHLHERSLFLGELSRVLCDDGILILSTPNANYSRPVNGVPKNPFHIFEYQPNQLIEELERSFLVDAFVGQTLDESFRISPFYEDQIRLPKDFSVEMMLLGWKVFNKIPFVLRERLSETIWNRPFYPTEVDYNFSEQSIETAPTLLAICRKRV